MSNPEQEQALATIAALAQSMSGTKLTDIQMDLLQTAERLMTNIAVQSQMAAMLNVPEQADIEFEIGEPVNVDVPANRVSRSYTQRATVTDKVQHLKGFSYRTSATGTLWMAVEHMHKVKE